MFWESSFPSFHPDILAYQKTKTPTRTVVILGEVHVQPSPNLLGAIEPLEELSSYAEPYALYPELGPSLMQMVASKVENTLQHYELSPDTSTLEQMDKQIMSSALRLERLAFRLQYHLWPATSTAHAINGRLDAPYTLLGWLTHQEQNVKKVLINETPVLNVDWHLAQRIFQERFLKHITSLEGLYQFLYDLTFRNQMPDWYTLTYADLGINILVTHRAYVGFNALSMCQKARVVAFFRKWFKNSLNEKHGELLQYLTSRKSKFMGVTVGSHYPLTQALFSNIFEILQDVQHVITFEIHKKAHSLHIFYVGCRHAHRLGDYIGHSPGAQTTSWTKQGFTDSPLAFVNADDHQELQNAMNRQLLLPGGGAARGGIYSWHHVRQVYQNGPLYTIPKGLLRIRNPSS